MSAPASPGTAPVGRARTRGVVFVHSAPTSLCPHVRWALERALAQPVDLDWSIQPAGTREVRAELCWTGEPGTGAALASELRRCSGVRFEVTEEPSPGCDGSRWSFTPALGMHHRRVCAAGETVVNEGRLRAAIDEHRRHPEALASALEDLLGQQWERELEPYRHAGDSAPARWLHKVG